MQLFTQTPELKWGKRGFQGGEANITLQITKKNLSNRGVWWRKETSLSAKALTVRWLSAVVVLEINLPKFFNMLCHISQNDVREENMFSCCVPPWKTQPFDNRPLSTFRRTTRWRLATLLFSTSSFSLVWLLYPHGRSHPDKYTDEYLTQAYFKSTEQSPRITFKWPKNAVRRPQRASRLSPTQKRGQREKWTFVSLYGDCCWFHHSETSVWPQTWFHPRNDSVSRTSSGGGGDVCIIASPGRFF